MSASLSSALDGKPRGAGDFAVGDGAGAEQRGFALLATDLLGVANAFEFLPLSRVPI